MKKFTTVCLTICAVLICFGIIFCMVGAGLGFGYYQFRALAREGVFQIGPEDLEDIEDLEGEVSMDNWSSFSENFSASEINNLDIQFAFGTLVFQPSDSEDVKVVVEYRSLWKRYRRHLNCYMAGDTLKIEDSVDKTILRVFSNSAKDASVTIYIPEGRVFDEISLDSGAGQVRVETTLAASEIDFVLGAGEVSGMEQAEELLQADELSLEIGAGHVMFNGIQAKHLDVDCGTGKMDLSGIVSRDINVDCGMGNINMSIAADMEEYNYNLDCGIGSIVLGGSSYNGIGHSKQINNHGEKKMDIDCGVGQVEIEFEK